MNFNKEEAAARLGYTKKQYIELIADNMIKTRPEKEVDYRPFLAQKGVKNMPVLYFDEISLDEYYPGAQDGDFVFLRVGMTSDAEAEIVATVAGNAELFYGGQRILKTNQTKTPDPENYECVPVMLKKGINELVIKCTRCCGSFKLYFLTALKIFKVMKARDYLFHTRTVIAEGEYRGEEGYEISRLYLKGESPEKIEYIYPPATKPGSDICFSVLNDNDRFGIAVTYALQDGKMMLRSSGGINVFINGENACSGTAVETDIKKGDEIAVTCKKTDTFGFSYEADNAVGIPFLTSQRKNGIDWLLLSTPEEITFSSFKIGFKKPYVFGNEKRFWRFADGSFLRIGLETSFFGQWFYALMVGNYGLLNAAAAARRSDYRDYFAANMKTMIDYYDYALYDATLSGEASFLQRGTNPDNLDSIGTMGMNFIEYYNLTKDESALHVIRLLENAMMTRIPRFSDGTFRRESTMWADDTFMSCPFIVRLAKLTGNTEYYSELKRQIAGFKKRLYMEDKKLFSHIFFIDTGVMNRIPWGRGNGWVMLTLTEILMNISSAHPDYGYYAELFADFAEGVLALQDEDGMWRQVLDIGDSYEETSATAMFVLCFARGVKLGILDKDRFGAAAEKGMNALLEKRIDRNGNICGVCKGSGCSMEAKYYTELETAYNDDHGTGIVLCALAAEADII